MLPGLQFGTIQPCRPFSEAVHTGSTFTAMSPNEPAHVHVDRDDFSAKFWLSPVALARNFGFAAVELRRLESLVEQHRHRFLEEWNGYFSPEG